MLFFVVFLFGPGAAQVGRGRRCFSFFVFGVWVFKLRVFLAVGVLLEYRFFGLRFCKGEGVWGWGERGLRVD